jgi:hypothetical protein
MQTTSPSQTQVLDDIRVTVVSPEEASFGVAEFWSGGRLVGFTRLEASELTLRIVPSPNDVVLGTRALGEALAEANRLLAPNRLLARY